MASRKEESPEPLSSIDTNTYQNRSAKTAKQATPVKTQATAPEKKHVRFSEECPARSPRSPRAMQSPSPSSSASATSASPRARVYLRNRVIYTPCVLTSYEYRNYQGYTYDSLVQAQQTEPLFSYVSPLHRIARQRGLSGSSSTSTREYTPIKSNLPPQ